MGRVSKGGETPEPFNPLVLNAVCRGAPWELVRKAEAETLC